MLWLRTQEHALIQIGGNNYLKVIGTEICVFSLSNEETYETAGRYKTKARCVELLEKIDAQILENANTTIGSKNLICPTFYMPMS